MPGGPAGRRHRLTGGRRPHLLAAPCVKPANFCKMPPGSRSKFDKYPQEFTSTFRSRYFTNRSLVWTIRIFTATRAACNQNKIIDQGYQRDFSPQVVAQDTAYRTYAKSRITIHLYKSRVMIYVILRPVKLYLHLAYTTKKSNGSHQQSMPVYCELLFIKSIKFSVKLNYQSLNLLSGTPFSYQKKNYEKDRIDEISTHFILKFNYQQ